MGAFHDDGASSDGNVDQATVQELPEAEALDAEELEW